MVAASSVPHHVKMLLIIVCALVSATSSIASYNEESTSQDYFQEAEDGMTLYSSLSETDVSRLFKKYTIAYQWKVKNGIV